ncbi:hypothetical protein A3Q56_05813 [Intoshia linei]|uniref:SRP54-type proteins GTP-binding domain-containing protein n=1 Tax=Intoshia linei TaxID=1819745 RepID=A0A177AZ62_9BILA|nr:hypothetical protein A3Q56_05813 [Intoshia linei]
MPLQRNRIPVKENIPRKNIKVPRKWDSYGPKMDQTELDYSEINKDNDDTGEKFHQNTKLDMPSMKGEIPNINLETEYFDINKSSDDEKGTTEQQSGWYSYLRACVSSEPINSESLKPLMESMIDNFVDKNIAVEVASKICESVRCSLEGKILTKFSSLTKLVKESLSEAIRQILTPGNEINILENVKESKLQNKPYVITFCGVNGVGKSTNLAKICYWLMENDLKVMISACDTFRAGAIEQLETHVNKLNSVDRPNKVVLFQRGYGKDAAAIAMQAIQQAKNEEIEVVLIDTAGRMQDNTPLMRALAKLIHVNCPDLVLFVGEALVGSNGCDQLKKFNRSLEEFSPHVSKKLIDAIILTKFDTIDDKVGTAVNLTYVTGQPILFIGTGQTYVDLKKLDISSNIDMNRFVIINFLVGCLTLIVGEYNSVGNRILFNWAIVENNPTEYIIAYRLREPSVLYGMSILFRLMDKINITIWKPIYYSDEWIRRNRLLNVHPIKAVKLLKSFEVGSIVELLRRDIIFKQENYECLHLKPDTLIGFSFQGKFCPVAYSLSTLGLDSFTLVPERNMNNRNRALELNKAYNVSDIIMPYEFSIKLFLATGADMKDLNGKCPNNETVLIDKYDYQFGLYKWFQSFHHEHDDDHDHDGNHGSNANTVKQSGTF